MEIFFILLAIYTAALIWISWRAGKNETDEGFLMADRNRSWWQVGFSKYAASVGAVWFFSYTGFAYEFGWPLGLVFVGLVAGVLVYASWAVPRIRTQETANAYTQGDYVLARTRSLTAKRFWDLVVSLMLFLTLVIAPVGAASLLDSFGIMSYEMAVIFTMVVVVGYILLSGFRAVMLTDILQGLLILGMVAVVVVGIMQVQPVTLEVLTEKRDVTTVGTIILMLFGFLSIFADPTRFQVAFAGLSNRDVARGMRASILPLVLTGLALYLIGNSVYILDPALNPSYVLPAALTSYLPAAVVPIGLLVFFVALMSTADSYIYALATHTAHFFSKKKLHKTIIRKLILLHGILITVAALIFRDLVDLAVVTAALLLVMAVPIFYIIAGGKDAMRFIVLLSGGLIGMMAGIILVGLEPDAGAFVFVGFLLSLLIPAKRLERWLA